MMPTSTFGATRFVELSPAEAAAQLSTMRIVDVREPHECVGPMGVLPGAVNPPLGGVTEALADWPKDDAILLVCRSGARSGRAATALAGLGFTRLHNLTGGMLAWTERGLPTRRPA